MTAGKLSFCGALKKSLMSENTSSADMVALCQVPRGNSDPRARPNPISAPSPETAPTRILDPESPRRMIGGVRAHLK